MNNEKVLLCGIGKLENDYIREWVEYHKNLGFTNIVLYDNNDEDGEYFENVIGDYIQDGYVIIRDKRGVELAQIPSYNECYKEFKNSYDWIGFWDIDEFIEFESADTVQEFVSKEVFDKYQCIRICWKQYTDNGIMTVKNDNYSVKRFTEVFDREFCVKNKIPTTNYISTNTQAKSLIRTNIKNFVVTSPHCFLNVPTVLANGEKCTMIGIKCSTKPIWKGAWLNHYRFKTIEEYVNKKMVRLWPTKYMNGGKDRLNLNYFFMFNTKTKEKEDLANELLKKNKKKLIKINSWIKRKSDGNLIKNNWGDDINYYFLPNLFDGKIVDYKKSDKCENYCLIGSIINDSYVDENTIIWGSGTQTKKILLSKKPKKVCAVRGPLTRKELLNKGIPCPEIYGDPSLLIPYYYSPNLPKKYKIGLIPHWSSINNIQTKRFVEDKRVHLIKLSGYKTWTDVIDEIVQCEYIISESLHGLIMAEAYNIPNLWVDISLHGIFNTKFHDFFQSLKCDREKYTKIDKNFTVEKALELLKNYKKGTMVDVKKLVEACPIEITNQEFLERINNNNIVKTEVIQKKKYEEGVSICMTAYKAKNFIKEALDSVYNQTWFIKHDNWEVLLGIDGCQETLEYVKTIMTNYKNLRVFMMDSNKGTYVTTNTLMSLARFDGLIRFDSDDVMLPEMVETIMKKKGKHDVVRFKMKNFGKNSIVNIACGQVYFKHSIFDEFGGYQPWSCNADNEFERRVYKFCDVLKLPEILFNRRIHNDNLTVKKDTNFQSITRKKYISYVNKLHIKNRKDAAIQRIVNTYDEIYCSIGTVKKQEMVLKEKVIEKETNMVESQPKPIPIEKEEIEVTFKKSNLKEKIREIKITRPKKEPLQNSLMNDY